MEFPEETSAAPKPITVKQLVYRLRDTVSIAMGTQWVVGELSNVKHHTSGHVYFTLKEQGAEIFCAFFKAAASKCPIRLQEGMKVHVLGSATVYPDRGQLQLVIRQVKAAGQGDLQTRFLELKAKLQREGLFDAEHKKKIPTFPRAIGIVTSPTGAVIQDMRHVLERRAPWVKAYLLPVRVQGAGAEHEIAAAVRAWSGAPFNGLPPVDVLIVGRGGGSIEDLWAFNDELVAHAIYESEIPVISAVGHEPDVTISDYVADLRAATPSNAAELAVPDQDALRQNLDAMSSAMASALSRQLKAARQHLNVLSQSPALRSPTGYIEQREKSLELLKNRLIAAQNQSITRKNQRYIAAVSKLDAMSPLKVLTRGYSMAQTEAGEVLRSVRQVELGERISVLLSDGKLSATVMDKKEEAR